ncbi:MAG: A/G-specific adenine glycosylase [Lachnospiraceae bacterium]|jgi:A/G-specific adenine glycosylase|nr:A/G-specific adenine glycosylase [Lachnospiraceae bacterium]
MEALKEIVTPLLKWYDGHARVLPWREDPAPYRVWVSEIMLQQTRVEAVKPYFERFLKELPTIRDLAEAPEDRLMKLWEGLGYYNRVRNMQKAARELTEECGGEMPADFGRILKLPGIGSYTAGAIASIAFGIPRPAVDGNVLRVLSRVEKSYEDILKQSVRRSFEEQVQAVIPKERAGDFNQSLIELGAIVCVPNGAPKCEECPLRALCRAHADGVELELPKKTPPKKRRIEERTVLVLLSDNKAALKKRPPKGLLAGLYELPNLEGHYDGREILDYVKDLGLSPIRIQALPEAKHIFSHIEWHMAGYAVKIEEPDQEPEGFFFVEKEQMEKTYSIPAAFGAYTEYFKHRF